MKNFFKRIKSYSFWVSFSGALIILIDALGNAFGFKVENEIIEDCIMSVAGILVVLGVVTMGDKKSKNDDEQSADSNLDLQDENADEDKVDEKTNQKLDDKSDDKTE